MARTWETPEILWAGLWSFWGLLLILMLTMIFGARVQRGGLQSVGRDAAPSIIHAQHIKAALADMDANAVIELLAEPGGAKEAATSYDQRRSEAAEALIEAAKNITYGEAERKPIVKIQIQMGRYEAVIQRAKDLHEERDNAGALAAYNEAAALMDEEILTAADALDRANLDQLEVEYANSNRRSTLAVGLMSAAGLATLGMLLLIQIFFVKRMKRLINAPLAGATALAIVFLIFSGVKLGDARRQLRKAREDAFASVHVLWQTKAAAYAAHADENRFLFDKAHAVKWAQGFDAKRDLIAKLPAGETADAVAAAVLNLHENVGFTGYLADELNNITFENEQGAALKTLRSFGNYVRLAPGHRNAEFQEFDAALNEVLKINQVEFSLAVDRGFADLAGFEVKSAAFAALMAGLAMYGMMQRIREYR